MTRRNAHMGLLALLIYLAFLGGATYPDTNIFLLGFHHLLMSLILIIWLLRRPLPRTALDWPLLAYVGWLFITTAFSRDWRVSLEQSWTMLLHVLLFYFAVDVVRQGRQRWLFEGLFLIAALVIIISVVEVTSWYFGLGFAGFKQGWFPIHGFSDLTPPVRYRLSLAFNVSTWLGNFVMMLLPLVVAWALTVRRKADQQALWLVGIGLLGVLFFSESRGALIGLAVATSLGGLLYFGQSASTRQRYLLAGLMGLVLVGVAGLVIVMSGNRASSDQGRRVFWDNALLMIQDQPITGGGVYQFGAMLREYTPISYGTAYIKTAHNLYLNTSAEIGVPGLLILLWLAGAFGFTWLRSWQTAFPAKRLRLIAVLAALAGFAVQSLVDTFTYTSTVLPVLLIAAFIIGEQQSPLKTPPIMRYVLAGATAIFLLWLLRADLAQFRVLQSRLAIANEEYDSALDKIQQAERLDPDLRLHRLQEAYILGLLANDNPDDYLDQAIAAYEQVLKTDPYFDVGHVNLAALYAQQGDYVQALDHAQQAVDIYPTAKLYWLKLGEYQEALGQPTAADSYARSLTIFTLAPHYQELLSNILVYSPFWDNPSPTKAAALELAYAQYSPPNQLLFALSQGWTDRADALALQLQPTDYTSQFALGYYAAQQGDNATAVQHYQAAIELDDDEAGLYTALAQAYLALGNETEAEKAAQTALFLRAPHGAQANAVLATLGNKSEQEINSLLINSVPPRILIQAYDSAVFNHLALLDYLPQVQVPGLGESAYEGWFLLAERYTADNDDETDPIKVYKAILRHEPYLERARELCGAACE